MTEAYLELMLVDGKAYVRRDRLDHLGRVDAVIFDCDGALIDTRNSYNGTISKTVAYILKSLIGYTPPERLISDRIIYLFRKSGGFNNDWNITYGILIFILCSLPEKLQHTLKRCMEIVERQSDPSKRLFSVSKAMKRELRTIGLDEGFFNMLADELEGFTESLNATGIDSVDRSLIDSVEPSKSLIDFYNTVKRFLDHPGGIKKSVVTRVFEEFFCGLDLFKKIYGIKPRFHQGPGMIENERVIIESKTLDHLELIFGRKNFGISSGSTFKSAEHILGVLLGKFNSKALVFLDNILQAECEYLNKTGFTVNFKKPNPFSLLKAAEALNPFTFALYVGDSMEDTLMVWEARKTDPRFLFAGVYKHSYPREPFLRNFLKAGCDIILPSVNDLPVILENVRRRRV